MDYIKVAENIGLGKELIVNIYKKISGGYYIELYYAKPPILYALNNWPKKYLSKRFLLWYNSTFNSEIDQIISLFITLDVTILHKVSSALLKKEENNISVIEKDIEDVFKEIEKVSNSFGFSNSPQRVKVKVNDVFLRDLTADILHKREKEINENIYDILNEIAYDSEFLTKIKGEKNWIRAVNKQNILKALSLEGKLNEFLEVEKIRLRYLIASKTLLFDKILLEKGIKKTIDEIRELKNEELQNEINKFVMEINRDMTYI
mgnify:CR=1 FL=1